MSMRCSKCRQELPEDQFYPCIRKKGAGWCKGCFRDAAGNRTRTVRQNRFRHDTATLEVAASDIRSAVAALRLAVSALEAIAQAIFPEPRAVLPRPTEAPSPPRPASEPAPRVQGVRDWRSDYMKRLHDAERAAE